MAEARAVTRRLHGGYTAMTCTLGSASHAPMHHELDDVLRWETTLAVTPVAASVAPWSVERAGTDVRCNRHVTATYPLW